MCMTDSFCTAETDTAAYSYCTPVKKNEIQ